MRSWVSIIVLAVAGLGVPAAATADSPPDTVRRLVETHCTACHDANLQEGGVNLENLLSADLWDNQALWSTAIDEVRSREMPKDGGELSDQDRAALVAALDRGLVEAGEKQRRTVGRVPLRRLTPEEYEFTLRDLLHLEHLYVRQNLPDQPTRGFFDQSFSNRAAAQTISPAGIDEYVAVADHAINMAGVLGPKPQRHKFFLTHDGFHHFKTAVGDHASYIGNTANRYVGFAPQGGRAELAYPGWYQFHFRTQTIRFHEHTGIFGPFPHPIYAQLSTQTLDGHKVNAAVLVSQPHRMTSQEGRLYLGRDNLMMSFLSQDDTGHKRWGPGVLIDEQASWLDGPIIEQWPPASYQALYGDLPNCNWWEAKEKWDAQPSGMPEKRWHPRRDVEFRADLRNEDKKMENFVVVSRAPEQDARRLLTAFMSRAFRRPVRPEEVDSFYELAKPGIEANIPFQDAIKPAYLAVLSSAEFLFFDEQPGPLDDFALANRLSYFLWRSMPDDELFEVAKSGSLRDPAVLKAQVDRMLRDPRVERFIESFANDWLQIDKVTAEPGTQNAWLADSMKQETYQFLLEMLRGDHDIGNLIDGDFVVINDKMAHHYGIEGVDGPQFRVVALPAGSTRGGLMTQAGVLDVTSAAEKTNPILRGAWVVRKIMGVQIPPPPPLPPQEEVPPENRPKTLREEIARHTTMKSCRDCHSKFDSVGFALEEFDPQGRSREFYPSQEPNKGNKVGVSLIYDGGWQEQWLSDAKVETGGETHDGRAFEDIAGLKRLLREDGPRGARHLAALLLAFATGENVQYPDRRDIEEIIAAQSGKTTLRSLIVGVVQSRAFQEK